jgi:hypothetical protein
MCREGRQSLMARGGPPAKRLDLTLTTNYPNIQPVRKEFWLEMIARHNHNQWKEDIKLGT